MMKVPNNLFFYIAYPKKYGMLKAKNLFRFLYLPLVLLITLASCNEVKEVSFPENASGFKVPVAKAFTMPEAKPIEWKTIDPFLIPKGVTIPLDFKKLPYKDFSINEFKPIEEPLDTRPLNWQGLEEREINLDEINGVPYIKKFTLLPEPTITKVVTPAKWEGSTSGIVRMGQSEGLIGNYVYAIVSDNNGGIWISTERGLTKYDGDEFKSYDITKRGRDGNIEFIIDLEISYDGKLLISGYESGLYKLDITTGILEHNEIGRAYDRIIEDHNGVIWLSNFDRGLYFIKPGQDSIYQLQVPLENVNSDRVLGTFEDSQNNVWIGFINNIIVINPERTALKIIAGDNDLLLGAPYEFTEDSKGAVWLSALVPNATSISLTEDEIYILGEPQGFVGGAKGVLEDALKRIWIMDNHEVTVYDPTKNTIKKIPTGTPYRLNGWPTASLKDENGMIWIGTQNVGMLIADPIGALAEHFDKGNGLASDDVWGLAEDNEGRVWLATYEGVNIFDQKNERLYYLDILEEHGTNDFRGLSRLDNTKLFAGGVSGFCIIDLEEKTITVYQASPEVAALYWRALKDEEGNLWIATDNGIIKINSQNNAWQQLNRDNGLGSNTAWYSFIDSDHNFWVATDAGLKFIDPRKNTLATFSKEDGLSSDYVSATLQTTTGEILIGGDLGFAIISEDKTEITNITAENGLQPEAMYDLIYYNEKIRVGSENGLIIVDRPTNNDSTWQFTNIGKAQGFPYNDYNQMSSLYTKSGIAWHAASPILSVIVQEPIISNKMPVVAITGLSIMDQHPTFQDERAMQLFLSKGDTLWTYDESNFITKNSAENDSSYLVTQEIKWDSINTATKMPIGLKLPHTQNSLSFTFVNSDIRGRDNISYKYLLAGADEEWSESAANPRSKNYYNLKPGNYSFKVATLGFNGIWSEPTEFDFTILPPWWQTWWAYGLYFFLFSLGVMVTDRIMQVRIKRRERERSREKELEQAKEIEKAYEELKATQGQLIQSEKMASLGELTAGIAHEIQNPLNFVNNFSEINSELIHEIQDERKKKIGEQDEKLQNDLIQDIGQNQDKINHHGKRASDIVKSMLEHSRQGDGKKELTDINRLADEYLRLAYHGLRAKDKSFNAEFETDLDESIPKIKVIPQDIGRVLLNLMNNAFHAVKEVEKPRVVVTTKQEKDNLIITVSDNGPGITEELKDKIFQPFFTTKVTGEGTGLGLSLSYDIVKVHGGLLEIESQPGEGAIFKIELPYNLILT